MSEETLTILGHEVSYDSAIYDGIRYLSRLDPQESRVFFDEACNKRSDIKGVDLPRQIKAKNARWFFCVSSHILQRGQNLIKGWACLVQKLLTGFGQACTACCAGQQRNAQALFKLFDGLAHSRGRNPEFFGRSRKVTCIGNEFQGKQAVEFVLMHYKVTLNSV